MVFSSISNTAIRELHTQASKGLLWMQTYFFKTPAVTESIIREAEKAGFKAICVTIDSSGLQIGYNKATTNFRDYHYLRARTDVS